MKQSLTLFFSCLFITLFAQNDLKIGQWEAYLPYRGGRSVTQSPDKIYFGSVQALLVLDKTDGTRQRISKTDGLSEVGVSKVKYHPIQQTLMVVYKNGVIDLLPDEGGISTLFFIRDFSNIVGNKTVYDIHVSGENTFLLGTNFGISEVNIEDEEFVFTTFTNQLNVFGVCKHNGFIYAAAEDGLYRVSENNSFIDAFGQWELLGEEFGLPADYSATAVEVYNDQLYLGADTTVFRLNPAAGTAEAVMSHPELPVKYLSAEGQKLIIGYADPELDQVGRIFTLNADNEINQLPICSTRPLDAVEDTGGTIWMADSFDGFYSISSAGNCVVRNLNAPPSVRNKNLEVYEGELWVTSGGISLNGSPLGFPDGFYSLIDGEWTIYNRNTQPVLSVTRDFIPLVFHPENGDVYAGSYFDGLAYYNREEVFYIDDDGTSLSNAVGDATRTRVGGLAFDSENNLWVTNYLGSRPISRMSADGSWQNFACAGTKLLDITIDDFDNKWIVSQDAGQGFVVFDEKEDRCKVFSSGNSVMESNTVNCITKDNDGDMWVGTDQGIVIFECGDPFNSDCIGTARTVEVDGIGALLLKDENVRSITPDGANRKWIGTSNGVFLLSEDGRTQIMYLSEDNSPLFDNVINDIAVDGETGKVYIGTDEGVQAVQGDAVEGGTVNRENPTVFPNPVRPDYNGPIVVRGLAAGADIKITDTNGQLIYETQALGGQAVWDGRDYNGRRAASGVYLVYSSRTTDLSKKDAVAAKILIIN